MQNIQHKYTSVINKHMITHHAHMYRRVYAHGLWCWWNRSMRTDPKATGCGTVYTKKCVVQKKRQCSCLSLISAAVLWNWPLARRQIVFLTMWSEINNSRWAWTQSLICRAQKCFTVVLKHIIATHFASDKGGTVCIWALIGSVHLSASRWQEVNSSMQADLH